MAVITRNSLRKLNLFSLRSKPSSSFDLSKCLNYAIVVALLILLLLSIHEPSMKSNTILNQQQQQSGKEMMIRGNVGTTTAATTTTTAATNNYPKKTEETVKVAEENNDNDDADDVKEKEANMNEMTTSEKKKIDDEDEEASSSTLIPSYDLSADHDPKLGKEFTDKYCIFHDNTTWYPSSKEDEWQLRAPYLMVPGVKKSGTTSISKYIRDHPLVGATRTKELQFFLNHNFQDFLVKDDDEEEEGNNEKILVKEARQRMYKKDYHIPSLQSNSKLISFDGTPGYIFFSGIMPQRILCVAPWIKLVIILRNPVDRVYSNWAYMLRVSGQDQSLEHFHTSVTKSIDLLKESGFLHDNNNKNVTGIIDDDDEESALWNKFLKLKLQRKTETIVGRSFYEIQLRQWFRAFRNIGRKPSSQIHFVLSENLHNDKQNEMNKVYKFLGLPPIPLKSEENKVVSDYERPMDNSTRKLLEDLFEPYNQKLFALLDNNGFNVTGWNEIWKRKT